MDLLRGGGTSAPDGCLPLLTEPMEPRLSAENREMMASTPATPDGPWSLPVCLPLHSPHCSHFLYHILTSLQSQGTALACYKKGD